MPQTNQRSDSDIIRFLGKHFVALLIAYRRKSDPSNHPARIEAVSGTIFHINGAYNYLTAGHCLARVHDLLTSDRIEILSISLGDGFGEGRIDNHPIPFALAAAELHHIDEGGLDVGVIPLWPYYVRLPAANGIVAFDEENWIHQHKIKFDGYLMLGLPTELTSDVVSETGEAFVTPTILRISELDSESDESEPTDYPRFIGKLDSNLPVEDIDGMSGGPIFGFRFGDETRYWIVAVQSSWRSMSRIVYGSSLPIIGSILTEAFKEFKAAS